MGKKKSKQAKARARENAARATKPCYFFTLPREIRDEIYSYIVSWPDLPHSPVPLPQRSKIVWRTRRQREIDYVDLPLKMSTPAIMLANIQIFLEIREFLDARPLISAPKYPMNPQWRYVSVLDYRYIISPRTLRNLKWVKFVLDLNHNTKRADGPRFLLQTVMCLIKFWRKGHLLERLTVHTEYDRVDKASHHQDVKELAKEVSTSSS
jgi:hypothetical protein